VLPDVDRQVSNLFTDLFKQLMRFLKKPKIVLQAMLMVQQLQASNSALVKSQARAQREMLFFEAETLRMRVRLAPVPPAHTHNQLI
jgi:hypothetical protein